ncbi:His/Gly/Thr/Pro-type tRNA ligase C-terminal domain-containing protein [Areca yellow leaf disease phytoplasma]|uniref:His/Gly/Thr/Pro-type tRNA ligase C-terminal domain-containing protein n=1 Tax=Areca yellow leaf disease phytoplasma TaxID=927614 RepID=UPI0035B56063
MERFLAHLVEETKGVFSFMACSCVQVLLIPVSAPLHLEFIQKIKEIFLQLQNFRVEINSKDTTLGYKIREAQKLKIPYQVVIGDNEMTNNLITFRKYGSHQQTTIKVDEFVSLLKTKFCKKITS